MTGRCWMSSNHTISQQPYPLPVVTVHSLSLPVRAVDTNNPFPCQRAVDTFFPFPVVKTVNTNLNESMNHEPYTPHLYMPTKIQTSTAEPQLLLNGLLMISGSEP